MPMAIGTAINSAKTELRTVTWKSPAMPNRMFVSSDVTNSELVMKLAWLAPSDGTARMSRNSPIRAIAPMMMAPAATATEPKIRSPHRLPPGRNADPGFCTVGSMLGILGVSPIPRGLVGVDDEPTEVESGVTAIEDDRYEIALMASVNLALNVSGTGMYPFSCKPS